MSFRTFLSESFKNKNDRSWEFGYNSEMTKVSLSSAIHFASLLLVGVVAVNQYP